LHSIRLLQISGVRLLNAAMEVNKASTMGGEEVRAVSKNIIKTAGIFPIGKDHVLNAYLRVKLVITFIFTGTRRLKTCLFNKSNSDASCRRSFVYSVFAV